MTLPTQKRCGAAERRRELGGCPEANEQDAPSLTVPSIEMEGFVSRAAEITSRQ
jgi:hypothetical protein